ncbi:MAG: hypothetical protein K1X66_01200 [Verrucomicrobiae bacterium]|nr:hypothetical protein [Verrucomicrobiae bacterium]
MNTIKRIGLGCFIMMFAAQLFAQMPQFNLVENGDFTKGKAGWETKGKIVKLKEGKEATDGDPALMIELDKKKEQTFSQLFKIPKGVGFIKIRFQVRTSDDFEMASSQPMEVTMWGGNAHFDALVHHEKLERSTEWQERWVSTDATTEKVGIQVTLKPGKGKVYFDNFVSEIKAN